MKTRSIIFMSAMLMLFGTVSIFASTAKPVIAQWASSFDNGTLKIKWYTYFGDKGDKAELQINDTIVATAAPIASDDPNGIQMGTFEVSGIKENNFSVWVVLSGAAGSSKSDKYNVGSGGSSGYKPENHNTGKWPEKTMVGYIDLASIGAVAKILETPNKVSKYNVIVFGFADSEGKLDPAFIANLNKIKAMETHGTINLLSVGGEHATQMNFDKTTAQNLYDTVAANHLDGVDFDIENIPASEEVVHLADLLREIFDTNKKDYFITAAPILATDEKVPPKAELRIAAGPKWDFTTGVYDAVFVQSYNSGENFKFPNPMEEGSPYINENSPFIAAASYNALHNDNAANKTTKIVIGIPANAGAALSTSNLWNFRTNETQWKDAANKVIDSVISIYSNAHNIDGSQFGGLMVWSLANDALPGGFSQPTTAQKAVNTPEYYFTDNIAASIPKK